MKPNPVVHFEMPYEDKHRMANFYTKAFGWEMQMLGKDMNEYVLALTTERDERGFPKHPGMINGGFYKKPEDKMGHCPSFVISVEDIKEGVKRVKEAGGKILHEENIPGVGLHVSFLDSEGNRVSMLQPTAGPADIIKK